MRWTRAWLVWLLIALAETVHGIVRQWLLVPLAGDELAGQIGVAVGSAIIVAIAWTSIGWIGAGTLARQLQLGTLWLLLMLVFEFALGLVLGYPLSRLLADYNPAEGGWMGLGMLVLLFSPVLAARARSRTD